MLGSYDSSVLFQAAAAAVAADKPFLLPCLDAVQLNSTCKTCRTFRVAGILAQTNLLNYSRAPLKYRLARKLRLLTLYHTGLYEL